MKYSGDGYHAKPEDAKGIARQMIASGYKEWDNDTDWQALVWIWEPASKLATTGSDWKDNAATQIKWGLRYIKSRYGSPGKAKEFWLNNNAY